LQHWAGKKNGDKIEPTKESVIWHLKSLFAFCQFSEEKNIFKSSNIFLNTNALQHEPSIFSSQNCISLFFI